MKQRQEIKKNEAGDHFESRMCDEDTHLPLEQQYQMESHG